MPDRTATTYSSAHARLRRLRGPARGYACVSCNAQAAEWAYDHACPDERMGQTRRGVPAPYSLDVEHYQPLCRSCHRRRDQARHPAPTAPVPPFRPLPPPLVAAPSVPTPIVVDLRKPDALTGVTKRCPVCEMVKDRGAFPPRLDRGPGAVMSRCRLCDAARCRSRYAAGARRSAQAEARAAARRAVAAPATREQRARYARTKRARNRARAVEVYGGCCAWCASTSDLEFDHVDNDGTAHRAVESEPQWQARVARTGAPLPDWRLQLLCAPCHRAPGWKARRATATPAVPATHRRAA